MLHVRPSQTSASSVYGGLNAKIRQSVQHTTLASRRRLMHKISENSQLLVDIDTNCALVKSNSWL